jgi:putative transposase
MCRREYPSDIRDEEWAILEPLIPPAKPGGRPRTTNIREVINALFSPFPYRSPMARLTA